jgi:release factor glutamine methyltransferase
MCSKTGFLTINEALRQGSKLLEDAGIPASRLTAEVLLAHALRQDRVYLFGHASDQLSEVGWIHYGRYLHQRMEGKPTQYITKIQEFYGRDFKVSPAVLIPRPETEHLVSAAIDRLQPGARVLDVGCGSGAIAISVSLETRCRMWAVDISTPALEVASENARRLHANVHFVAADLLEALAPQTFDAILSNPPYVGLHEAEGLQVEVREHEPHLALFGGPTGIEIYARLVAGAGVVLRPGGWLILELGWKSLDPVQAMLQANWSDIEAIPDLAGIPRILAARWTP